jgi:hypothetical protein
MSHPDMNHPDLTSAEPQDEMECEYDFSGAVRGKHHLQYKAGTNLVLLDPDLVKAFPDSESVNRALRLLLDIAKTQLPSDRVA